MRPAKFPDSSRMTGKQDIGGQGFGAGPMYEWPTVRTEVPWVSRPPMSFMPLAFC
jgi:hypothetical protein